MQKIKVNNKNRSIRVKQSRAQSKDILKEKTS